jgi:uncharacterized protein with PQ loop repeat
MTHPLLIHDSWLGLNRPLGGLSARPRLDMRHNLHHRLGNEDNPSAASIVVDRFIYVIGFIGPLTALPQITEIWFKKNATAVSGISSAGYLFLAVSWLIYGIVHKVKPIIFTSVLWVIFDLIILVGVMLY